ncbi:MAG TPA: Fur family transcriptional regulator [Anaerolineales bacterium]|nr:Fur family transcriptional regulator [Anaerolineales bacterium]
MNPPLSTDDRIHTWLALLQGNGYRLTTPRRAVVETMAASDRSLSPADVYDLAREECPGLGLVTVYRTLEKLEELGAIQRVHHTHGCQAFVAQIPGHNHLLLCQNCGRVEYFTGDELEPLMTNVARNSGYEIREHWLQLFGLCQTCRT